jgi:hypothetical protein
MPKTSIYIYDRNPVIQERLLYCAECLASIFPEPNAKRQKKSVLFSRAAAYGVKLSDRPELFYDRDQDKLAEYIAAKWSQLRIILIREHEIVPVYVNGVSFGEGQGYRKGDLKHAKKQVVRDDLISDGVVRSANDYAKAIGVVFPQIATRQRTLVSRALPKPTTKPTR